MRSKRYIFIAGIATLFGIGGAGIFLLMFFHNKTVTQIFFESPLSILHQSMAGISYGLLSSFLLVFLLRRKFLSNTKNFFSRLISKFRVNYFDVFFLSFCAGVGEEIFFRAAIQPWLGIWLTSLLFIGLHGYLNLKDKPLFIYGVVLFFVSLGFGFLMEYAGLWSAMIAHFLIDVLLLSELKKKSLLQGT